LRERYEEIKRDQFKEGNNSILDQTNDPSVMAVPEHHLREQKLKQKKMSELRKRNQKKRPKMDKDADFEKMFGKDIDEFLEDSDWDIESFERMSQFSRGTARSLRDGSRLRGLESIYLQRLETSMKKGHGRPTKKGGKQPRFRVLQDRFVDDPEYIHHGEANEEGMGSVISDTSRNKRHAGMPVSANTTSMGNKKEEGSKGDANIFSGHRKMYDTNMQRVPDFNKRWLS